MARYHYNVADNRLAQHIEKGNEDGLYISSVASCTNLWALIMDAGTGFGSQVYELSQFFLHKVNIVVSSMFLRCHIFCQMLFVMTKDGLCADRNGLWNNGRRIFTSVP